MILIHTGVRSIIFSFSVSPPPKVLSVTLSHVSKAPFEALPAPSKVLPAPSEFSRYFLKSSWGIFTCTTIGPLEGRGSSECLLKFATSFTYL